MAGLSPVAQRRATRAIAAAAIALAFEPVRLGRRVEAKAGADATVVMDRADVPEVLREDEDGFRAPTNLAALVVSGQVRRREWLGGGEDASFAGDQRAERGRGAR